MKYRGVGKRPGDNHHKIEIARPTSVTAHTKNVHAEYVADKD